jgi:phage terminase large subunit
MDNGATRASLTWHRRSGKDKSCLNYTIKRMPLRIGTYFYFFPTYAQAKKAIWEGRDKDGFAALDHFPAAYVQSKNVTELQIKTIDGSIFQLVGTDNIDSIMSTNPVGCVFAEYSLQDPRAWEYVRPILRENGGWAIFNQTPRGNNHGKRMNDLASQLMKEGDPAWFHSLLTINDTGILNDEDMDAERREGMDEEMIRQEYYCSFEGVQSGAYYGKQMDQARKDGRICKVVYQPEVGVDTWWDLGIDDAMAIWFTQTIGREVHLIDYMEASGEGFPYYAKELQAKPYVYASHHAPHDIKVRELGSGKSRLETAASLGIKFEIVPDIGLADGIDAARSFLARCWFDEEKTERGRDCLVSYHKTWDDKRKTFSSQPYHDWASNGADGFRYLSVGHKIAMMARAKSQHSTASRATGGRNSWLGS